MALSKRRQAINEKLAGRRMLPLDDALGLLQDVASAKFDESMDVALNLGVDPRKSDQVVRGATVLPHGTGKQARVAVFAQGQAAEAAAAAGADVVGMEDLAERMRGGELDFSVVIAAPDAMRVVGTLGQLLGPRGLMPNPKVGTVTPDVAAAVNNAKKGQVRFRTDKAGIVHCVIGRVSFPVDALRENLQAVLADVQKLKPATSKGVYVRKVTVSTTMGPGLSVDLASLGQ
ncbi:MAG TPA: 50S ribosomal protein L1 [Gammaproteobacteria bacterium]|jgi:large subunit ribosomal protein L1|uniref:50S ribosomal protein L1 n=1 Tax=Immundisolibacter sp. TaxID=1934948 RepID=UPI000E990A97|nr:50S ribosomal protein L1 [Gammaproteobacteria bacterium]HCZ49600.1 50S ribosomal protein L1 [Gammaproteobacteria bacterium]MCH79038.1 50S ribosomal protein L1 [Gammaproteobacteria bacterium]